MKITGQNQIAATPQKVWEALNDPDVLRQSIPGCESLEKISDSEFKATVVTKIGPVKTKFNGEVQFSDLDPPNGYTLSGKGSGGSAGNAKGSAKVTLTPDGNGTLLSYDVDAQVTGKLAQLGSRLIQSSAKMLAGKFFDNFQNVVAGPPPAAAAARVEKDESKANIWLYVLASMLLALLAAYVFIL